MLTTRFTELIGCSVPIQQAPIGGLANADLVAAVSNAGALGMKTVYGGTPDDTAQMIAAVKKRTRAPFGANFVLNFMDPDTVRECIAAAAGARLIEFFYSDPDAKLVAAVHEAGAVAGWQVGSRDEAKAAVDAGCDLVVAQGIEAGGHVRGKISLLALLDQVVGAVKVPVVAAGGIGSGRAMAAVLAAGADGVRIGTRFVASVEAGAHPVYVDALIRAEADDTLYSDTFNANWIGAPHRCLRASVEAALACTDDVVAELVDEETGERVPIARLASVSARRAMSGNIAAMPHWAGESVGGVKCLQPAAEIVRELVEECELRLRETATQISKSSSSGAGARTG